VLSGVVGVEVAPRPDSDVLGDQTDALTPTEARVAELAAQGLRNAEIAARLQVTRKTVEATLSRVYRKLGVRSRTELARREASLEAPEGDASGSRGSPLRRIT
jgi:DNA-binding CsgD family transcriptional regulator